MFDEDYSIFVRPRQGQSWFYYVGSKPSEKENIMQQRRVDMTKNEVRTGTFIVGSISSAGEISFSSTPRVHETHQEARLEAERLAKNNPGKEFLVSEIKGRVRANAVNWS